MNHDDPLWMAVLEKIREMEKDGWRMAMRSTAYRGGGANSVMVLYQAYAPGDKECAVAYVFHVEAYMSRTLGDLVVEVDGPFENHHDTYWKDIDKHDEGRAWIVTPDWRHYTIEKDLTSGNRDLAGHAGAEFIFDFIVPGDHVKFKELGLRVFLSGEGPNDGDGPRLYSKNVWSQNIIPPKWRHLWQPNATVVPWKPMVAPSQD